MLGCATKRLAMLVSSRRGGAVIVLGVAVVTSACLPAARPAPRSIPDASPSSRTSARAPVVPAPRRPVVRALFGDEVTDDYGWLEDGESPEVRAFAEAQDRLARTTLAALPGRAAVKAKVASIYDAIATDWFDVRSVGGRLYALEGAPPKRRPVVVDLGPVGASPSPPIDLDRRRVIVDPDVVDPSGEATVDHFAPSPDGRVVAVSLARGGDEGGELRLIDVATGEALPGEAIAHVKGGSVAWSSGGSSVFYTRRQRAGGLAARGRAEQVWRHELGAPASTDTYAIGEAFPPGAEVELKQSADGALALALVSNGQGAIELYVFDGRAWSRLARFEDELSTAAFGPDGRVYAATRSGAPRGRIVAFAPPWGRAAAVDVLPESDAIIDDLIVTKDALYVIGIADGRSLVRRFVLDPKPEPLARELRPPPKPRKSTKAPKKRRPQPPPPPPITIAPGARGPAAAVLPLSPARVTRVIALDEDLLLRTESFVEPSRWVLYRAAEHRLVPTSLAQTAYGTSDVEAVREACAVEDDADVSMSILRKRGAARGAASALLTDPPGFGASLGPRTRAMYRVWLDRGGIVVEANARGGGERGGALRRADDLLACASSLVDRGYAEPGRLVLHGQSSGARLMAALVERPEMFRGVVAPLDIYDMLRSADEDAHDEARYRALRASSPFFNVKDGTSYPAVLLVSGAHDPRVDPYHARKMVARLQAATTSDRPILLRTRADAELGAEIEETTDALAFLLDAIDGPSL